MFDAQVPGLFSSCTFDPLPQPHPRLVRRLEKMESAEADGLKLVMLSPIDFGVLDSSEAIASMSPDGSILASAPVQRSTDPFSWSSFFIDMDDVYGSSAHYVMGSLVPATGEFTSLSESYVEQVLNRYACSVSAMYITGMALMIPMGSYNTLDAYKKLWELSDTTPALTPGTPATTVYGTTAWENVGPALSAYAASQGVSLIQSTVAKPSFSQFKQHVDKGRLSIFSSGKLPNGAIGHSVSIQGYGQMLRKSDNSNIDFLFIADGWHDSAIYFNYIPSQFTSHTGSFFS